MAFRKKRKLSKKEAKAQKKQDLLVTENSVSEIIEPVNEKKSVLIELPQIITVRELAERFDIPVTNLISELIKNGVTVTINESIDYETAAIIADELGYKIKAQKETKDDRKKQNSNTFTQSVGLENRPPIVVVMGHVDHGKTTLLDKIRQSKVADFEIGKITQHIGAYQVKINNKKNINNIITFLDTPGHEAFSAMRAHGANITDIAILVVAADDGVKPQTKEAISHAKAAGIPILVAINKVDKPEADIEKVKRELGELGLVSEEWGGDTVMLPISAKSGKGVEKILEILLVIAELEDLKAQKNIGASGVVIESHMERGMGPVATVLIQNGVLKTKDVILLNNTYGKIKKIENDKGVSVNKAFPSDPVRVIGLKNVANFGDIFEVAKDEKEARFKLLSKPTKTKKTHLSLGEISQKIKLGQIKELNILLKTDTQGSLTAIQDALSNLSNDEVVVRVVHSGIGDVTENDVNLAISAKALIIGFSVLINSAAKNLAYIHGIKINTYNIIYELIDDISSGLSGLLEPEIVEKSLGKLKVLKIFKSNKDYKIIGGKVISGKILKSSDIKIVRDKENIGIGVIDSLEKEKKSTSEVTEGFECGLGLNTKTAIEIGDIIESFEKTEIARKISQS